MLIVDFTQTASAVAQAVAFVSKHLPVCAPCERNLVYDDKRQSVHVVGPLLILVLRAEPSPVQARISVLDLVHLHVADARGDTAKAEADLVDALASLFPARSEHRGRILELFAPSLRHAVQ